MHNMMTGLLSGMALVAIAPTSATAQTTYSEADFARVAKLDAHVHDNVDRDAFLDIVLTAHGASLHQGLQEDHA